MGLRAGLNRNSRTGGKSLMQMLHERATGKGLSAAEGHLKKGLGQNLAQTQANIKSVGGLTPALKQRLAQSAGAVAGANIATETGILRATEQAQAEKSLSDLLLGKERIKMEKERTAQQAEDASKGRRMQFLQGLGAGIVGTGKYKQLTGGTQATGKG